MIIQVEKSFTKAQLQTIADILEDFQLLEHHGRKDGKLGEKDGECKIYPSGNEYTFDEIIDLIEAVAIAIEDLEYQCNQILEMRKNSEGFYEVSYHDVSGMMLTYLVKTDEDLRCFPNVVK